MISTQTGNPVADELINLSPGAKDALMQGVDRHIATTGTLRPGDATSAPPSEGPVQGAIPLPQRQSAPMGVPEGVTTPGAIPVPQMASKPVTNGAIPVPAKFQPPPTPMYDELSRVTKAPLSGDQAHTSADTGRSGIGQIHNPWARIPLQILDAVGRFATPGLEAALPGTEGHHQEVVADARGAAKEEQGENESVARQAHEAAGTALEQEQTRHQGDQPPPTLTTDKGILQWNPETHAYDKTVGNAAPKEEMEGKTIETDQGIMQWNPKTHAYDTKVGDAPGKTAGTVHVLPDGSVVSVNHDAKTGKSTAEVVYKGDPKIPTEVKQLEIAGKPHQVLVNSQTGATIKDLGETGEKPPTVNVNAGQSALDRESSHFGAGHQKAVDAANAQLEKIGEARAMLSTGTAESQALAIPKVLTALVSGQGSGVRITQAELNQLATARGIKGDFQGWIQKISSGKKLIPEQQQQLIQVLDDAANRLAQKRQIANDALNGINGAKSRDEMTQIDKSARDKLAAMETGGKQATVKVANDDDFNKLASGTHFIDPQGKERVKP